MTTASVRALFSPLLDRDSFLLGLVLELVEGGDLLDHIMKTAGLCKPSFYDLSLTGSNTTPISRNRRTGYHISDVQRISSKSDLF